MTVRRHGAQAVSFALEQHAVQVVAHVLARHGELGASMSFSLQLADVELEHGFPILDVRVFGRRQGRQVEAGAAGTDDEALALGAEADLRPSGRPRQMSSSLRRALWCGHPWLSLLR